ncbi:hypothetical protein [Streptomyces adonidis]|uniref:hypothetical protein n=1 Tax=Streptomyces adonidis TaxID=3231367 RepID=UPI0034DAFF03
MLRYYGTDLLDWHRGRLSSRRLAVLVKHLPRDCALNRELHGEAAEWTVTDHLLAATVDHLAAANWMFASVNSAEDADPPELPVPVPRPADGGDDSEPVWAAGERYEGSAPDPGNGSSSPSQVARFFG